MREHPIPQDITGYKFHLVGSMTLKQFAELVVGSIIALFFYKTNLPAFIKWPLIFSSVGLGFAVAFVPFEERPLDHWLITFFKTLYKPTKFYWQRETAIPDAFTYQPSGEAQVEEFRADLSPARKQRIQEFIQSIDKDDADRDGFDEATHQKIGAILSSFETVQVPDKVETKATLQKKQKPNLKVRVRKLNSPKKSQPVFDQQAHQPELKIQQNASKSTTFQSQESLKKADENPSEKNSIEPKAATAKAEASKVDRTPLDDKKTSKQPATKRIKNRLKASLSQSCKQNKSKPADSSYNHSAQQITKNKNLPFPSAPTKPNKLVGMVITPQEDMVDGAIVEIKDQQGQMVRAVKTNSLGQFFVSTPLNKGTYFIDIEKEGLTFKTQKLVLKGKIIDPLEIRAETT